MDGIADGKNGNMFLECAVLLTSTKNETLTPQFSSRYVHCDQKIIDCF